MDRSKIADKLIKYLDKNINCNNLVNYIEKNKKSTDTLIVSDVPIMYRGYTFHKVSDNKFDDEYDKFINVLDFTTDSNYLGSEHFPYIYGVISCYENDSNNVYVFKEAFSGNISELFDTMTHISEWYDIIFQILIIDKYVEHDHDLELLDLNVSQLLFKKHPRPIYKSYTIDSINLTINHKFLIVVDMDATKLKKGKTTCNLLRYLRKLINESSDLVIKPSPVINKLLDDLIDSWWEPSILDILNTYYNR